MRYVLLLLGLACLIACKSRNRSNIPATKNMDAFLDMLDGKWEHTTAAFKKYAEDSLQMNDMTTQDLKSPVITGGSVNGADTAYVIEAEDKAFAYQYTLSWRKGKIFAVQTGSKKGKN